MFILVGWHENDDEKRPSTIIAGVFSSRRLAEQAEDYLCDERTDPIRAYTYGILENPAKSFTYEKIGIDLTIEQVHERCLKEMNAEIVQRQDGGI